MKNGEKIYVYLDQNQWIELARAYYDRPEGQGNKIVLQKILDIAESGNVIFPLSHTHVIETNKRRNLESKQRLASFMVEISRGNTIASQFLMTRSELERAIATKYGANIPKLRPAFGLGIPFIFGLTPVVTSTKNPRAPINPKVGEIINAALIDKEITIQQLIGNEKKLEDAFRILEDGRKKHVQAAEEIRKRVRDYDKRLLKRAYVANLIAGLYNDLNRILNEYGQTIDDFLKIGANQLETFFAGVSTLDMEIELATRRNEHWDKKIDGNDISDISSLCVAIPYCDIVVTEVFWTNVVKSTGVGKKYNTQVISSLNALLQLLP